MSRFCSRCREFAPLAGLSVSSQCILLTLLSVRQMSHTYCRPMVMCSIAGLNFLPVSGPLTTSKMHLGSWMTSPRVQGAETITTSRVTSEEHMTGW